MVETAAQFPGKTEPIADVQVTIAHFTCHLNLPQGLESPMNVRDRFTRLVQHQIPDICGTLLTALPGDNEAVYRIRHLQ